VLSPPIPTCQHGIPPYAKWPHRAFRDRRLWLGLWLSLFPLLAAAAPWRVVILPGADVAQPAAAQQIQALRTALKAQAPDGVEFYIDALDGLRFDAATLTPPFVDLLKNKYAQKPVDLVIGMADFSLEFTQRYHDEIWPGVPVLITSVDSARLQQLPQPSKFAYLPLDADIDGTLALIATLQPQLRRLIVVTGDSAADRDWSRRVSESLGRQPRPRWQVDVWSGLPLRELLARVASLDASAAVLYTTMYRDTEGGTYFPYEVVGPLSRASRAPVYGWYETYLRLGIAAGSVIDFTEVGQRAADLGAQIIRKAQPAEGASRPPGPTLCAVDIGRLDALGLSAAALPNGCLRVNEPPSLWREHRGIVLAGAATLLLQALTIGLLLWQRERRRRAEEQVEHDRMELTRAARIASIGELSASIAHEVSQPLGAIANNADAAGFMLDGEPLDREELRQVLGDVRRDALRASQIIQRQRAMLNKHVVEFQPLALDAVLDEAMVLMRPEARRRGCELLCDFGAGAATAMADRVQMQQVLLNLVLNAMDAVTSRQPERRRVIVATRVVEGWYVLTVTDNGHGIAADVLPYIFDAFVTTKSQGTGIGLSIVRGIVHSHRGQVTVATTGPQGTTFDVRLPVTDTATSQPIPAQGPHEEGVLTSS